MWIDGRRVAKQHLKAGDVFGVDERGGGRTYWRALGDAYKDKGVWTVQERPDRAPDDGREAATTDERHIFAGVASESLLAFRSCLVKWCEYVQRYCDVVNRETGKNGIDVPFWYNERATLSTFSAAIAAGGGLVLEEYSDEKVYEGEDYSGRVDLWFQLPETGDKFVVEAKQAWVKMPPTGVGDFLSRCDAEVRKAVKDAASNRAYGGVRFGFAFVVPMIQAGEDVESVAEELRRTAKEEADVDALAWVFPVLASPPEENGYVLPGVFLFVKAVE